MPNALPRNDLMPYDTGIKTELISKASKIVSNATGFPVQFNKAIVGKNPLDQDAIDRAWAPNPLDGCHRSEIEIGKVREDVS